MATSTPMSPEELQAKAKLPALSEGIRVWALDFGEAPSFVSRYAVPSSQPALAYEVIAQDGGVSCNCPSGHHRGMCKHIGAVLLLVEAESEYSEASGVIRTISRHLEQEIADIG